MLYFFVFQVQFELADGAVKLGLNRFFTLYLKDQVHTALQIKAKVDFFMGPGVGERGKQTYNCGNNDPQNQYALYGKEIQSHHS
jgi:hypothetical protein